jgi:NAD(P)-dependent dehydrogenase (short-subunit alcohol dehydrogenase family)
MFVVNYLAKFILLNRLIAENCISFSSEKPPRIIIISSESHRNPETFDWESFGNYKAYGMNKTVALYGYYKLLLTTFANELSRKLNRSPKTASSILILCPGPINSNIAREAPALFQPLLKTVFRLFFRPPGKAAEPVVYLTASPDEEGKLIDYLHIMARKEMDDKATDPENGKKLWEMSEELVRKISV